MKIFGVGLSKTGTTSLAKALELLGYKVKDCMGVENYVAGDLVSLDKDALDKYDAFTDTPIPSFFRELDAEYPGSKFILTERDMDGWLQSCKKQFNDRLASQETEAHGRLFEDMYGTRVYDRAKFEEGYQRFSNGVKEYFAGRPNDLLVMDVTAGDGWEVLCPFLNTPIPHTPFPMANVTLITWIRLEDLVGLASKAGRVVSDTLSAANRAGLDKGLINPLTPGRKLKYWADLVRFSGKIGREKAQAVAEERAKEILVSELRRFGPDLPVVFSHLDPVGTEHRQKWNHFWLVEIIDGVDGAVAFEGAFSINIALVEDRAPIIGVVHVPRFGVSFYASAWGGSYVLDAEGDSRKLESSGVRETDAQMLGSCLGQSDLLSNWRADCGSAGVAVRMCMGPFVEVDEGGRFLSTCEWQTAPAQVFLKGLGRSVIDENSKSILRYNKDRFSNGPVRVC